VQCLYLQCVLFLLLLHLLNFRHVLKSVQNRGHLLDGLRPVIFVVLHLIFDVFDGQLVFPVQIELHQHEKLLHNVCRDRDAEFVRKLDRLVDDGVDFLEHVLHFDNFLGFECFAQLDHAHQLGFNFEVAGLQVVVESEVLQVIQTCNRILSALRFKQFSDLFPQVVVCVLLLELGAVDFFNHDFVRGGVLEVTQFIEQINESLVVAVRGDQFDVEVLGYFYQLQNQIFPDAVVFDQPRQVRLHNCGALFLYFLTHIEVYFLLLDFSVGGVCIAFGEFQTRKQDLGQNVDVGLLNVLDVLHVVEQFTKQTEISEHTAGSPLVLNDETDQRERLEVFVVLHVKQFVHKFYKSDQKTLIFLFVSVFE